MEKFNFFTLVFEYGFDFSDESESLIEFDDQNQLMIDENSELEQEMKISITP